MPWTGTERCCSHYSIHLHDCSPVHHNTHDLRNSHRLPSQITMTKRIHHQSLSSPYHPPYLPKPSLPLQLAVFQKRENEQGSRVFHTDSVQDNIDSWGQLLSCCVIPASSWIQHHSPQVRVNGWDYYSFVFPAFQSILHVLLSPHSILLPIAHASTIHHTSSIFQSIQTQQSPEESCERQECRVESTPFLF